MKIIETIKSTTNQIRLRQIQVACETIKLYETKNRIVLNSKLQKKINNKIVDKIIDKIYNIILLSINRKMCEITTQLIFI